jgi:thiol-disulfide isomerase/thioredoxin
MRGMKTLALLGALWALFPLKDAAGTEHPASELKDHPVTVLVFLSTECPLCNRAIPDLNALSQRSAGRVRFFAVNAERDRTAEQVLQHDREYALAFPTLLDPRQELAKAAGATVTPEAVVLGPDGALLYRGRLDDRAVDFGKVRPRARREDLRIAIDEALAGSPISVPETPVLGCYIQGATK